MKLKIDCKRLGITIGIVLLTALVVGGTVWYLMNKEMATLDKTNTEEILLLDDKTKSLERRIDDLSITNGLVDFNPKTNWNIYSLIGFGLQYEVPKNLEPQFSQGEDGFGITFVYEPYVRGGDGGVWGLEVYSDKSADDFKKEMITNNAERALTNKKFSEEGIKIDGANATKYTLAYNDGGPEVTIVFEKDGHLVVVSGSPKPDFSLKSFEQFYNSFEVVSE